MPRVGEPTHAADAAVSSKDFRLQPLGLVVGAVSAQNSSLSCPIALTFDTERLVAQTSGFRDALDVLLGLTVGRAHELISPT